MMRLVPFQIGGKTVMFAGTGLDNDPRAVGKVKVDPSEIPEPQIIALESSEGPWRRETTFGRNPDGTPLYRRVMSFKAVHFATDGLGNALDQPVDMLVAGLTPYGKTQPAAIFTGALEGGKLSWAQSPSSVQLIANSGRSTGFFHDPATGVDRVFMGVQLAPAREGAIISGVYDPTVPGRVRWGPDEMTLATHDRIMAFATLDDRFFAIGPTQLFERVTQMTERGPVPSWNIIYEYSGPTHLPLGPLNSGLRGLTPMPIG
jgi:hypothetical protein